jgi:hypothetical protein
LFYHEAWDSLASIHAAMIASDRYDVTVVTIPRKLTGESSYGGEKRVHRFLKKLGVRHLRFNYSDSALGLERLRSLRPHYVFLNYPWQRNYQPGYRPDMLAKFTKIVYTPYFLAPLVDEEQAHQHSVIVNTSNDSPVAEHLYRQRVHQLATLVFCQDERTRGAFASTERGNSYVHAVGSAKLDSLRFTYRDAKARATESRARAAKSKQHDLHVLWAPHHSYSAKWLNFGTFAQTHMAMLELARSTPNVRYIMRPHPFLFGTLIDRGVLSKKSLNAWLKSWNALPNTQISGQVSFAKQFARTDLLISDGISFLAEYPLLSSQPGVFIENPNHWEFNAAGALAKKLNLTVSSVDEIKSLIDTAVASGVQVSDLLCSKVDSFNVTLRSLSKLIDPNPGQVAERILQLVEADFATATPLVSAESITETPWEDMPGREPRTD